MDSPAGKSKFVTMKEVAAMAGCSAMSVSLALRGSPEVGAKLGEKIRALAKATGYRPNPLVAALVASRRKLGREVIAVLTKFDEPLRSWSAPREFYSDLHAGLVERADELGFRVEEFPVHGVRPPTGAQLTRILRTRGIHGVVLFPGGGLERGYPDCDWRHFSVVAAGFHARAALPVHRTSTDYMVGMDACLSELERRGYKRIGLAFSKALDPNVGHTLSGRFLAWREQQPSRAQIPLVPGWEVLPSREVFLRWFRRYRPDCILTTDSAVTGWLHEAGLRVPNQVGVAALPVRHLADHAGMDARTREVGRLTINLLARELYLNHSGLPEVPEVALVAGAWRDGATVLQNAAGMGRGENRTSAG